MADVEAPSAVVESSSSVSQVEIAAKVLADGDAGPKAIDEVAVGSKAPPSTPIRSEKVEAVASTLDDAQEAIVGDADGKKAKPNNHGYSRFPTFRVTWDSNVPSLMSVKSPGKKKRRNSLMAERFGVPMAQEMTPQATLAEFIVTSASYHGVKGQEIKALEDDLFRVFRHNVMPANAAAWYMAKRRFYLKGNGPNQLLPMLLKEYPKKFALKSNVVQFLESYSPLTARSKMRYLVEQGLYAYFSHKADEYGVYFFDPLYYEETEPFHANLRMATNLHNDHGSKLIPTYFKLYRKQFFFKQLSPYLVSISKADTEVIVGMTGIIVSLLDKKYGLISFNRGAEVCTALFSTGALFKDGYQLHGDPKSLPPVFFDGFRIPSEHKSDKFKWFAVLTWVGRKPNPKFCSTKEELLSCPYFRDGAKEKTHFKKSDEINTSYMKMGTVTEIRKNGAVAVVKDSTTEPEKVERFFVPGWAFKHVNTPKAPQFLTTTQGVGLSVGDLINFYVDPKQEAKPYDAVACNVDVLKHAVMPSKKGEKKVRLNSLQLVKKDRIDWKKFLMSEVDDEYKSEEDPDYDPGEAEDSEDEESDISDDEIKGLLDDLDKSIEVDKFLPPKTEKAKGETEINENVDAFSSEAQGVTKISEVTEVSAAPSVVT